MAKGSQQINLVTQKSAKLSAAKRASLATQHLNIEKNASMKKPKNRVNVIWFKNQLARVGLTQRAVAKLLKVNHTIISHVFSGRRRINLEEAAQWAAILGVSVDDVMINAGAAKSVSSVNAPKSHIELRGWVDGNLRVQWTKPKGPTHVQNMIPVAKNLKAGVVRCQTSGSPYEGYDGALMFYYEGEGIDPDALGRICLVKVSRNGGSPAYLIRILKRGYESGRFNLAMINGTPAEEGIEIDSASPIVCIKL